jgi:hypothetical protein
MSLDFFSVAADGSNPGIRLLTVGKDPLIHSQGLRVFEFHPSALLMSSQPREASGLDSSDDPWRLSDTEADPKFHILPENLPRACGPI